MHRTSFLVLLCILKCIGIALAVCTVSKHEGGRGNRSQCSNVSLENALSQSPADVSTLMILQSNLQWIPQRAFAKFNRTLESLNIHKCQITDIHWDAFGTLSLLTKLSLPNNNITRVRREWFKDLVYLEQLDLSFNQITFVEPTIFSNLQLLKRLDVRENRLDCLDPHYFPGGIAKVYFRGNPLNFICRGTLTLWLWDHGVSYRTDQSERETWLDKLLWHCASSDPYTAKSEILMKECVVLNLFNQLRTGLSTAESYPLSVPWECVNARNALTSCIASEGRGGQNLTNGYMITSLLLSLHRSKSTV